MKEEVNFTIEDLPEVKYAKFEDWSKLGYKIKKGSKAIWYMNEDYFTEFQVEPYKSREREF